MNLRTLRRVWRALVPRRFRKSARYMVFEMLRLYVHYQDSRCKRTRASNSKLITVVGLFDETNGIANSAKLAVRAFQTLGIPYETLSVSSTLNWGEANIDMPREGIWLFYLNAPELVGLMALYGPKFFLGTRYAYWAWELPEAPSTWLYDSKLVDQVLVPSEYTAKAFGKIASSVNVVPHPLFSEDFENVIPLSRDKKKYRVLALFDFNSSMERKNILGTIEAFNTAFSDKADVELVVKTQNGDEHLSTMQFLKEKLPKNSIYLDEKWPYEKVKRLIASADVFVSLHRAEGFGLVMAEAMAMGVPVVASGYSGNCDFMNPKVACMVRCKAKAVADDQGIYTGQVWGDPDLDEAVKFLRSLYKNPTLGKSIGEAGKNHIKNVLSTRVWAKTLPPKIYDLVDT